MKRSILAILVAVCLPLAVSGKRYVVVLGTAQDAGAPQIGCASAFCKKAWKNRTRSKMVSSIALVDDSTGQRWIFDATPDLPWLFQLLMETTGDFTNRIDGVFLTHAHIGHYTGLMYFGRESINAKEINVYAMPRMASMLRENAPWSQLVRLRNIEIKGLADSRPERLSPRLSVVPFLVPHRDEFSETVGFRVISGETSLIYLPDIDKWSKWKTDLTQLVRENDYLLLDGTFFEDGEIPRPISEVPHPFISETISLLKGMAKEQRAKVHFIHLNHSNPVLQGNKTALKKLKTSGTRVAETGMRFDLGPSLESIETGKN